jgi:hypothetical protein
MPLVQQMKWVPCDVQVLFAICIENCFLLENIIIMSVMFISSGMLYSLVATTYYLIVFLVISFIWIM